MTLPLTNMFDDSFENAYKSTPAGMAHLSGSGPDNRTCRECECYYFKGGKASYYAGSNKHSANGLKPGKCRKYRELMKREGGSFPHHSRACKHFSEAEQPPVAVKTWGF